LTTFTRLVVLVAVYFVGGLLGKEASFLSGNVALVWPPAGIALAAILLFGYRFWPGVALGAVLFSFINGMPFGFFTFGTAIGNTIGAVACAFLLKRCIGFDPAMERTRDVTGYIGLACFLGTTINAAFNVVSLIYSGTAVWEDLFSTTLVWWVPNALAGLVVAPFILTWARPTTTRFNARLLIEAAVCGIGLIGGTLISFNSWFVYGIQSYPLAYLPFPFLVWGALRFGQRGATTGTLLVSSLAIYSLLRNTGPFVANTEKEGLMLIGSYIGILAVTNLLLAAAAAERRQAEQATSESERRFRAVVDDQTDLICRFKPDGTLTFVNEAFCRFHGQSSRELIGTPFFQTFSAKDAAVPLSYFNALPADEPVVAFDHSLRGRGEQLLWQQYRIRRLFQENGETLEFQAVIQDITHRKRSDEALRSSEQKHRSLVDHIPDVVWTANAERDLSYISANAQRTFGHSAEELLARGRELWLDRIHPEDAPRVSQAYAKLFSEGDPFDVEYRLRRASGEWIWLQDRALTTRLHEGALCADGISLDVTRRRQAEAALQQTKDAAEAANLAKSQFLANMSHELRTPLNAIIGFSEILVDKTFGELNARQQKYCNNILNSGRHLLQLINDILDLAKVEAGRMDLTRGMFNVALSLQNVQSIVKALAHKKQISLEFETAPGLPVVFADEAKFKQVMYNLLSNAIKFTHDGGRVVVRTSLHETNDAQDGLALQNAGPETFLRVSVTDTGVGIKPGDQERIFEEFEQVDSSYGRQQQGTGLGLALTKRLIEMHGGRIWVESDGTMGSGSTFSFLIPLLQPEKSAAQATEDSEPIQQAVRPRVLFVTANEAAWDRVGEDLRSVGYEVVLACGTEAMTKALNAGPSYAVVLDRQMFADEEAEQELHNVRYRIPARIPVVLFSPDSSGQATWTLLAGEHATDERPASRLVDAIRGTQSTGKEVKSVLIVDDEPAVLDLLTRTVVQRGTQALRASHGRAAVALALRHLPDAIILDLRIPELSGIEVVAQLRANPKTRSIPILVHTGGYLDEEERHSLAGHVQAITSKTERGAIVAELDRLEALECGRSFAEAAL